MAYVEVLILLTTVCGLIYIWCKRSYSYWTRHGIPQMDPTPIIGNIKSFLTMKTNFGLHVSDIYNDKRFEKEPVVGIYILNQPGLIIRDLELIKSILVKDFNKFSNRYSRADPHHDALGSNNLFLVRNPHWREIRTKLTPVFTSGKIKQMYPLMLEIATDLENHLKTYKTDSAGTFTEEIKEICALYTTDMIASTAFGIRAYSLQNPKNDFRRICYSHFNFDLKRTKDFFVAFFLPKLVSTFRAQVFTQEFSKFLRDTINHVMEEREKSGKQRNDLIDVLVGLRKSAVFESSENELKAKDNDFLVAQGAVFLTAGFETSSSTMAFALYELAKRPDLQERLREEICDALLKNDGVISYETINTLEYLGMVIDETLRLYPVLPFLDREHMHVESEEPFSLKPHYDYTLPNGMPIYIPVFGIQRNPQYWEDPNTFNPERFSGENRKQHQSMSYLPFGTGPHNCIGMRFGVLQARLGLVHFLKNHRVAVCEQTPKEIVFDPKAVILQFSGGINLQITNDQMYSKRAGKC